jgi:membrane associated rhomboid family serine protease
MALRRYYLEVGWLWGFSIVMVWVAVAVHLDQPLVQQQRSPALVAYGAFKGTDLSVAGLWRLIASQWLHVNFHHMLFNALIVAAVGQALQARTSAALMLAIGVGGGAIGQLFSAWAYPAHFMSGASQAYLALCGAGLLVLERNRPGWWVAAAGSIGAVVLDVFVSGYGAVKTGHWVAFMVGLCAGAAILYVPRPRFGRG